MKGLLQRLAARAGGRNEGLRPRAPLVFEFGVEPAANAMSSGARMPRTPPVSMPAESRQTRGTQELQAGAATSHAEPARFAAPHAPPGPRDVAVPRAPARASRADSITPRPLHTRRVRDHAPPASTMDATEPPISPAVTRVRRTPVDAAAAEPVAARSRVPRPPWTFETAVPRTVPGVDIARAPDVRGDRHEHEPHPPEPVVRVTIERLDVHAAAPPGKPRRPRPVDERRDTLAEYARKRREAKR